MADAFVLKPMAGDTVVDKLKNSIEHAKSTGRTTVCISISVVQMETLVALCERPEPPAPPAERQVKQGVL